MKKSLYLAIIWIFMINFCVVNYWFAATEEDDVWNSILWELESSSSSSSTSSKSSSSSSKSSVSSKSSSVSSSNVSEESEDEDLIKLLEEEDVTWQESSESIENNEEVASSSQSSKASIKYNANMPNPNEEYDYESKSLAQVVADFIYIISEDESIQDSWNWALDSNITLPKPENIIDKLPLPKTSIIKKWKTSYLKVEWNIDKVKYDPIVLVSKNWKTFTSWLSANWEVKLDSPWRYTLAFQVKQNGKYMTVYETTIDNTNINWSIVWNVKTWPMWFIYAIILLIAWTSYFMIRNKNKI